MMHRYYRHDFSPWWFLPVPLAWAILLVLAFPPEGSRDHHQPGVRHQVETQMDIPLCYQVDGLPAGYCDQLTKEAP